MRTGKLPWRRMLSSFVSMFSSIFLFRAVTNWHLFASRGFGLSSPISRPARPYPESSLSLPGRH